MDKEKKFSGYPSIDRPWLKYYPENAVNAPLPECTIYEYLWESNKEKLNDLALIYFGKKITFRKLFERIEEATKAFAGLGIKGGDVVSVCSPATPELIYSLYALNRLGATVNLLEPRNNPERIQYYLELTNSKYMVMLDRCYPKINAIIDKTPLKKVVVISLTQTANLLLKIGERLTSKKYRFNKNLYVHWKNFIKESAEYLPAVYEKSRAAIIIYTGGTTGVPKGVMLSDDAMNAVAFQMGKLDAHFMREKSFLNIMPPFIAYGVTCGIHMPLSQGMKEYLIPNFTPEKLATLIVKHKPNSMMGVPSFYEIVSKSSKMNGKNLSFLETCGAGGDAFSLSAEKSVNAFLQSHNSPNKVYKGYGMTEVCSAQTSGFLNYNKDGSVGIPFCKNTVAVFKPETEEELLYNAVGEICFQTPSQMLGYVKNEEETAKVIQTHEDGSVWIHTGDLGYVDEDGFVFIVGRSKRMIVRPDGHNVFPSAIEAVLGTHPAVEACSVVGKKADRTNGSYPMAFVVLKPEYRGQEKGIQKELVKLGLQKLPERDQAEYYCFINELPLTSIGKIDFRSLEIRAEGNETAESPQI